ncbi:unnamed protein product [Phaeothamnion confervicola]
MDAAISFICEYVSLPSTLGMLQCSSRSCQAGVTDAHWDAILRQSGVYLSASPGRLFEEKARGQLKEYHRRLNLVKRNPTNPHGINTTLHLIMVGARGCGQSCLLNFFRWRCRPSELVSHEELRIRSVGTAVDGSLVKLHICDKRASLRTSGFAGALYTRPGSCLMLVFNCTDPAGLAPAAAELLRILCVTNSFATPWYDGTAAAVANAAPAAAGVLPAGKLPIVLVAAKADYKARRTVRYDEGAAFARAHGCAAYVETSAVDERNCDAAFLLAAFEAAASLRHFHGRLDKEAVSCSKAGTAAANVAAAMAAVAITVVPTASV